MLKSKCKLTKGHELSKNENMINGADFEKMNFCIRRAMTDTMPENWELFPRTIFDHELLFVEKGRVTYILGDESYEATEGDIILIPPRVPHAIKSHRGSRLTQPHVHFDFEYKEDFSKVYICFSIVRDCDADAVLFRENYWEKLGLPYVVHPSHPIVSEKILSSITEIIDLRMSTDFEDVFLSKYKLSQIISLLIHDANGKKSERREHENLYALTDLFIEKNVLGTLDLNELAKTVGYSKNYLSALYKKRFGMTPLQKHEKLKTEKAKEYLIQKNVTVSEIADLLGYPSVSDFSREFKRICGVSPTVFGKSARNSDRGA